jgi:hypothetical protein
MALLVALAIGGVWYGVQQRRAPAPTVATGHASSGSSASPDDGMSTSAPSQSNAIMPILMDTNDDPQAKGYIPPDRCQPVTTSKVSCTPQNHGADSATFQTYASLRELYSAYLDGVQRLSGRRPAMTQTAVDDCNTLRSSGEVSWNHLYEHPRSYTIGQVESGRLQSEVAGGRLFCTIIDGREHILWTHNDIKLLGEVIGYGGHAQTFLWWKRVHHNMGPSMSRPMSEESSASSSTAPGM